jgi:hypothetical protein
VNAFLELIGWRRSSNSVDFGKAPLAMKVAVVIIAALVIGLLSMLF